MIAKATFAAYFTAVLACLVSLSSSESDPLAPKFQLAVPSHASVNSLVIQAAQAQHLDFLKVES